MVVYIIRKIQANKFVKQDLIKIEDEIIYTNVQYNTNFFKKHYFNC